MYRLIPALAAGMAAFVFAAPAHAADFGTFRPGLPGEWDNAEEYDPLTFEAGLRYWYSKGEHVTDTSFGDFSSNDTSHLLEGHLRIDDGYTSSFVKAYAGYSAAISGTYPSVLSDGAISGGRVGYVVADFGYAPLGTDDGSVQIGGIVGYHFWNDSPETGRGSFYNLDPTNGLPISGDSRVNNLDIHGLRLGVAGRADFGQVDVSAEVAAIPYAWMSGTLGADTMDTFTGGNGLLYYRSSETTLDGAGLGAAAELMVGFKPTDNIALRLGGRAWYVGGELDSTFSGQTGIDNGDGTFTISEQGFIDKNWTSVFRYGALVEASVKF